MSKEFVAVFLAPGCEEIEALTVIDILFRAKIACKSVSVAEGRDVVSSHNVHIVADAHISEIDFDEVSMIVLPGGIPGTPNLHACEPLVDAVRSFAAAGKPVSAICAAPSILAKEGLLKGRRATSNPGFQQVLRDCGAEVAPDEPVVVDGNFITSQGMGTAIDFALEICRRFKGSDEVERLKGAVVYWDRA